MHLEYHPKGKDGIHLVVIAILGSVSQEKRSCEGTYEGLIVYGPDGLYQGTDFFGGLFVPMEDEANTDAFRAAAIEHFNKILAIPGM